ncbi:hypothetical protein BDN70DRAFT_872142 [Pholiota conissans]|uniref:Uncharacterized protein n=1 Tax=Pholiota conissans TaxID=109636 RepID=A0A9P5ZAI5_9AGAR|nr:hypothetical protein BDN70DRAFT_872142 [Pholiota conissans]
MTVYHRNHNTRVTPAPLPTSCCSPPSPQRPRRTSSTLIQNHLQITPQHFARQAKVKAGMSRSIARFPAHLERPNIKTISSEAIEAVAPAYKDVPVRIVREQLLAESSSLVAGLHSADFSLLPTVPLPKEVTVPINDFVFKRAVCPTHLLAIPTTIRQANGVNRIQYTLYPIHELVFAASCSSFIPLPPSAAASEEGNKAATITLPVVQLVVPAAWTFPILHHYLYTKDTRALKASLLPPGWDSSVVNVMKQAKTIVDVHRNAVGFGVVDETMVLSNEGPSQSLYDVIDESWAKILTAMREKTTPPPAVSP